MSLIPFHTKELPNDGLSKAICRQNYNSDQPQTPEPKCGWIDILADDRVSGLVGRVSALAESGRSGTVATS